MGFDFSSFASEPKTSRAPKCERDVEHWKKLLSFFWVAMQKLKDFRRELLFFCKRCVLGPNDISLNFLIIASLELYVCENKNWRFWRVLCAWTRDRLPAVLVRPSMTFPTISTLVLSGKSFRISVFRNICDFQDKIPNDDFLKLAYFFKL
jgi:hypothetical protein